MQNRAQWQSRLGFVLAATGSAVGLGNIWKFPYITGMNGGGLFVLVYLFCIAGVGIPILAAEVLLGRATAQSPVGAFRSLSREGSPWVLVGGLGVLTAGTILSYYGVVAGWCLDYVLLSATGRLTATAPDDVPSLFGELYADPARNVVWLTVFTAATVWVILGGVRKGVERASLILMPLFFLTLVILVVHSGTLPGFGEALDFLFTPRPENLSPAGVLEALGHSFFSLSVAMGAMLTYGSYLSKKESIPVTTLTVGTLDTLVALVACLVLFPIIFTFGMEASAGPGLVFMSIPAALVQLPLGALWSILFFALLFLAAWTSAISLLEVLVAYGIDEWKLSRKVSTLLFGAIVYLFGIPSALSGGEGFFGKGLQEATGRNWFDWFDYVASNWFLPLGGLGISIFVAWKLEDGLRRAAFGEGTPEAWQARLYAGWLMLLRYLAPVAIVAIFLHVIGVI
ncbi:MAG: sodium-dependent transporter [Pseudomonadota bacterium]|nr:MAG: sodium-dependent transporter [Pseudomonadota bacterium]